LLSQEYIRAQIAEKEQQKEETRMKKALEERQEEERLARQRERLQREYLDEQERIKRKEVCMRIVNISGEICSITSCVSLQWFCI